MKWLNRMLNKSDIKVKRKIGKNIRKRKKKTDDKIKELKKNKSNDRLLNKYIKEQDDQKTMIIDMIETMINDDTITVRNEEGFLANRTDFEDIDLDELLDIWDELMDEGMRSR